MVSSLATAKARDGRWARVVATLREVVPRPDDGTFEARLALGDGSRATVERAMLGNLDRWKPLVGREVTVVGRLRVVSPKTILVEDRTAICAGRVERCGEGAGDEVR